MSLPNQLSILRIILAPVFLFFFMSYDKEMMLIGFGVYMLASFTDWYDGWHARRFGQVTRWGIFLDPFADKVLTSFAFVLFYMKGIMPLWMVITIVVRDIFITVLRSYHEARGFTMKTSMIAKAKTFFQMSYIFLVLGILVFSILDIDVDFSNDLITFLYSDLNYIIMMFITGITLYTGVSYFFEKKRTEQIDGDY
ncbi:MAG TPA: CDP-diacylglycerol--glycerol-3-phosphate 3-phosphatidyltransferase [Ignavibacteria bacterium]|nr:CDP-diacylglycerol--glycerol-3-phosphate 3-phosphatidyltransferase [Ignavibacteria bacterium]